MARFADVTNMVRSEQQKLDKKFYIFEEDRKCDLCNNSIFSEQFYFFNCIHAFHQSCMIEKLKEYKMNEDVDTIEKELAVQEKIISRLNYKIEGRLKRLQFESRQGLRQDHFRADSKGAKDSE